LCRVCAAAITQSRSQGGSAFQSTNIESQTINDAEEVNKRMFDIVAIAGLMTIDPGLCANRRIKKLNLTSGRVDADCGDHPQFHAGEPSLMVKHNFDRSAHKRYA
jgi:hypothetical protein